MPHVSIAVDHDLPREEAIARMQRLVADILLEYASGVSDIEESWEDGEGEFSFRMSGMAISGRIDVQEDRVLFDMKLPLLAMAFKGRLESEIRRRADILLA